MVFCFLIELIFQFSAMSEIYSFYGEYVVLYLESPHTAEAASTDFLLLYFSIIIIWVSVDIEDVDVEFKVSDYN